MTQSENDKKIISLSRVIKSLEQKQHDETLLRGAPHLSTQVKLYLAISSAEIEKGNLSAADKAIRQSFVFLNLSYKEALTVRDKQLKDSVFNSLKTQQWKLVSNYVSTILAYKNQLSVELLDLLYKDLTGLVVVNLYGRSTKLDLYRSILISVNNYLKNNKVYILDDTNIIDFINEKFPSSDLLDDEDIKSIEWVKIRIYQLLVRQNRSAAFSDPALARTLSKYRKASADMLYKLGVEDGYAEDFIDSQVYKVIATKNKKAWSKEFRAFCEKIEEPSARGSMEIKTINRFYLKSYIHIFELTDSLISKRMYLKSILYFAHESRSVQYYYFLPIYYLLDLYIEMPKYENLSSASEYIKNNHTEKMRTNGTFVTHDNEKATSLYSDITSFINGCGYNSGNELLISISKLWETNVIPDEKNLMKILMRALSVELDSKSLVSNVSLAAENFEENDNDKFLDNILKADEGSNIEVKLSMDDKILKKIAHTICAFANDKGGTIIIGLIEKKYFGEKYPEKNITDFRIIANEFVLMGYKNFDRARTKLSSLIKERSNIDGTFLNDLYNFELIKYGDKTVGIIHVKSYASKYKKILSYENRAYRRYDNQNLEMTINDMNAIFSAFSNKD